MSNWFGMPKRGAAHHTFRDVRIQHGGKTWTATWHVADGRLFVGSACGSTSEPISDDVDPPGRAAELLHAMVAGRGGNPGDPVGF
jgi:hypothetical protein